MRLNGSGATIESCVPGRIRVRLPNEQRCEEVASDIQLFFGDIDGVENVTVNMITGSVLVEHDPRIVETSRLIEFGQAASIICNHNGDGVVVSQMQPWPDMSDMSKSILRTFRQFDRSIRQLSNGKMDAKLLSALLLVGMGSGRMLLGRRPPAPWYTLLWYGYSMFMHWHNPNKNGGLID